VERLLALHGGEYLTLLEKGEFKQVCVVCRARRKMRSHHCKECGRCVERLDHHCPWIDNCVGLGNQRSFYCFIVMLLVTIANYYYVVILYAFDTVFPELASGTLADLFRAVASGSLGPGLRPVVVLVSAAFDLVWLAFVGALVARHTAYMAVNVTTYEVLVRPAHVQRRFPKNRGRFWFLQGFGVLSCINHCLSYWLLSTENDAEDFMGMAPQDSGSAAPDREAPPPSSAAHTGVLKRDHSRSNQHGPSGSPAYHLLSTNGTGGGDTAPDGSLWARALQQR